MGGGRNFQGKRFHRSSPWPTRWTAPSGSRYADGSQDSPFCPESAAFRGVASSFQQAVNALPEPSSADDEDTPRLVRSRGGVYPGNSRLDIPGRGSYLFHCPTKILVPDLEVTRQIDPTTYGPDPMPATFGFGGGGFWNLPGSELVTFDTGARTNGVAFVFERLSAGEWNEGIGSFASAVHTYMNQCYWSDDVAVPTVRFADIDKTTFDGIMSIDEAGLFRSVKVSDDVTIASLSSFAMAMFIGCKLEANFNGPVGTATFDDLTAKLFAQLGGSFAGGASPDDYLASDCYWMFADQGIDIVESTIQYLRAACPCAGTVTDIHVKVNTHPIVAPGSCNMVVSAAGNDLTSPPSTNLQNITDDVWTALTLTASTDDLDLDEGDDVQVLINTGATLTPGSGNNVRVAIRLRQTN